MVEKYITMICIDDKGKKITKKVPIEKEIEVDYIGYYSKDQHIELLDFPFGVETISLCDEEGYIPIDNIHLSSSVKRIDAYGGVHNFSIVPHNPYLYVEGNCVITRKDDELLVMGKNAIVPQSVKKVMGHDYEIGDDALITIIITDTENIGPAFMIDKFNVKYAEGSKDVKISFIYGDASNDIMINNVYIPKTVNKFDLEHTIRGSIYYDGLIKRFKEIFVNNDDYRGIVYCNDGSINYKE